MFSPPPGGGVNFPKKHRGFSLIETAIILGVIGLVIGGIWTAAASTRYHMAVSDTAKGMLQDVHALRALHGRNCPYSSLTEFDALSYNLGAASLWPRSGSSGVKPPLGGQLNFFIDCAAYGFGTIMVSYGNYTADMCYNVQPLLETPEVNVSACHSGSNDKTYYYRF